jgi:hypothetical protein
MTMKRSMTYVLAMLSAYMATPMLTGCPPTPVNPTPDADAIAPPPAPEAGPVTIVDAGPVTDVCALACANLRTLGCPEGDPATCGGVCSHAQQGAFDMKPSCLAGAKTVDAVRQCGSVSCKK